MLVVIVGRSGAGKSTFIEAMGLPGECHCVLSQPMVDEVRRRDQPVDHDHIYSLAKEWYATNKWWQLDYLLEWVEGKSLVLVDGLRYAFELVRLREFFPEDLLVVKIVATPEERFGRLKDRGKIPLASREEFDRLERDESVDMGIDEVLVAADLVVENFGTAEELREKAIRFGGLLKGLL